jgi:mRNA-decapping enzyme subunit 2
VERICFQVEEAQWFYEDFVRPLDPALPSLSLKAFAMRIFQHCPLMSEWSHYHHMTAFSEFLAYKTRVPVRGAIMLNESMDEVVLVKGWKKGANWSFPRGKINKDEKDIDCAIREVYEETGFDIREAGLVKEEKDVKYIEITMREQHMRLYVFRGVPLDTQFAPRTRKEISKIEWYKLSELPTLKKSKRQDVSNANKFYMVAPFLNPLKKWIAQQRKLDTKNQAINMSTGPVEGDTSMDEGFVSAKGGFMPRPEQLLAAGPSDLPEVTASQDVSSHLKRLLNIGESAAPETVVLPTGPVSTTTADPSKSNKLLALLRGDSHGMIDQTSDVRSGLAKDTESASNMGQMSHVAPAHSSTALYPPVGFQRQDLFGNSGNLDQLGLRQDSQSLPSAITANSSTFQGPQRDPPRHNLPSMTGLSSELRFSHGQPIPVSRVGDKSQQHGPRLDLPHHPPQQQAAAPFRQTGDPQFAQKMHNSHFQGPSVPPASKLPPPKLTSHSLALLSVFKPDAARNAHHVESGVLPASRPKSSRHQDTLLSLLQASSPAVAAAVTPAAELSAQPTPSFPKQILQRQNNVDSNLSDNPAKRSVERHEDETLTSATVSGPLKTPEFDKIGSLSKRANGTPRRSGKEQLNPTSPITILSRPPTGNKESPVSSISISRPSSQTPIEKVRSPEPPKNFQPQILRRSDKMDLNTILPSRTIPVREFSQSEPAAVSKVENAAPQRVPRSTYDRRPSQTTAQKETLLSLFGKSHTATAAELATPIDQMMSTRRMPVTSGNGDAVSSPSLSGREAALPTTVSSLGSPSEGGSRTLGVNQVTTPDNKAFLLGFLQNVAEGKR